MELGLLNKKKFNDVRDAIFNAVSDEVCSQWGAKIQPYIGVWDAETSFSFEDQKSVRISDTGVLSFPILIKGKERFTCSIFMFFGEVRIGMVLNNKIDYEALKHEANDILYNHNPVLKMVGNAHIVDWCFKNEWVANMTIMQNMMIHPNVAGAVADAISKQTIHLLISTVVAITSANLD